MTPHNRSNRPDRGWFTARMTDEQTADFTALMTRVFPLYGRGEYDEALRVTEATPVTGLWAADHAVVRASLLALVGRAPEALAVLQEALEAGGWWDPRVLLLDDDLAAVRVLEGFDQLVATSEARVAEHNTTAEPVRPVIRRPDGTARGVVAVLHGASGTADAIAETWAAATREGWVLLSIGSSYRTTPARRSWPEQPLVIPQIRAALACLEPAEREVPLVAGGFSAGSRAALLWALSGDPVPVAGVVAVSLSLKPTQLPDKLPARLPGLVLGGTDDPMIGDIRTCCGRLAATGIRLEEVEGMSHDTPADFDARLAAELARHGGAASR
jgi:predicted alpha/beta-hydrolase family hydrolase